jgi:hypothetical protein
MALSGKGGIIGLDVVRSNLAKVLAELDQRAGVGIQHALETVMVDARKECPKDTHALVNSAYSEVEQTPGGPMGEAGFNRGFRLNYALLQHEVESYRHNPGEKWKFLQGPLEQHFDELLGIIAEQLKF